MARWLKIADRDDGRASPGAVNEAELKEARKRNKQLERSWVSHRTSRSAATSVMTPQYRHRPLPAQLLHTPTRRSVSA
jgi:hypothetical protein